jgi:valyl-tRNA synthetase
MNVDTLSDTIHHADTELNLPDRWIRSRLGKTIAAVKTHFDNYRLDLAAKALYEFTWHEYCDWYLELSKPILQGDDDAANKYATLATLTDVLENLLRCLHPFIPFITEEIWQRAAPAAGIDVTDTSIMIQPFPDRDAFPVDDEAEQELDWIRNVILGIRQIRGEMDIAPNKSLPVILQDASEQDRRFLKIHERYLMGLAKLSDITILKPGTEPPPCATALLGRMKILVPMAGLIDIDAERQRLEKNRNRAIAGLGKTEGKLANEKFRTNAPDDVIAKEQAKREALRQEITQFDAQLARLDQLSEKSEQ